MTWRIGVDIGGTFTDVAMVEEATGRIAIAKVLTTPPDFATGVLQGLRQNGSTTPVLVLTARGDEADKVRGLKLGADDYVTKPFGLLELLARVEALLRRASSAEPAKAEPAADAVRFGDVEVHPESRTVLRAGAEVPLTPKEFDLLLALIGRGGRIAGRVELMREVWGHRAAIISRTVDTHVAELRRKLELDPANPRHILTVRKAGYRFQG